MVPDHHHVEATRKAARHGLSLSEYICFVARDLGKDAPTSDPSVIFGLFDGGGSRIADGKQAMISEAIEAGTTCPNRLVRVEQIARPADARLS